MALTCKPFGDIITFTRASTATYFDSAGVLQTAAIDAPRFDYNPSTLAAQGLLIEEARTNGIRNNTMQGAVAGGAGTFPTNWAASLSGSGVTQEITAVGTENGIAYIDIRYFGTPTAGTNVAVAFEPANQIAAASGQTWTESVFLKLQAGSFGNTSTTLSLLGTNGTSGTESISSALITSTPSNLRECRLSVSGTFANAGTTNAQPRIRIGYTVGVAFDITLRIGLPQLEQGAFATSVIPTTTTALTRSADVASVNTLSPWYNATAGTLYTEVIAPQTFSYFPCQASFHDGTASNYLLNNFGTGGAPRFERAAAGVGSPSLNATPVISAGALLKQATAFAVNDFSLVANGGTPVTSTSGNMPSVTALRLGGYITGSGANLNGYLRRIVYYPRRLSNAELQSITS